MHVSLTDKKNCTKCGEQKYLYQFVKDKDVKSGRGSICLGCNARLKRIHKAKSKPAIQDIYQGKRQEREAWS